MNDSKEIQTKESVLGAIVEKLETAKHELEDLVSQLASGKVEPMDKFEEIKREFQAILRDLRLIVEADTQKSTAELVTKIIELETALLSEQVDARKVFDIKKKVILAILAELEDAVVRRFGNIPAVTNFIHEAEKLKLKLEILRLRFVVKKFRIKNTFRRGMDEAVEMVRTVGSGIRSARAHYHDFRDEIRQAYSHMKKAVKGIQ